MYGFKMKVAFCVCEMIDRLGYCVLQGLAVETLVLVAYK